MLQVLSDERERASSGGAGDMDPEETGYSMAFVMDAWTHPCGDEAKAQSLDVPVRMWRKERRGAQRSVVGARVNGARVSWVIVRESEQVAWVHGEQGGRGGGWYSMPPRGPGIFCQHALLLW